MIEYEALTELYLYDMKIRKRDEYGEPALANMIIPANTKYETTAMKEYLATAANNYYRVLTHNEPADDVDEPAKKMKYDERKFNDLAEAAKNENKKAFPQKRLSNAKTNEEEATFAQTRATNNGKDGGCLQRRDELATAARKSPETKPMAARATAAPATPATKKNKETRTAATTASRKMTFGQFQRYKVFLNE